MSAVQPTATRLTTADLQLFETDFSGSRLLPTLLAAFRPVACSALRQSSAGSLKLTSQTSPRVCNHSLGIRERQYKYSHSLILNSKSQSNPALLYLTTNSQPNMADRLFKPLKVGHCQLQNRLVMAPLTRFRADKQHNPSEYAKKYYEQRASVPGTLLVTEATFVSNQAGGYPNIPGIWSESQIAGWKDIVDAVHKKGSFIYLQLWGLGRVAQEKVLKEEGGWRVRSASAIAVPSDQTSTGKPTTVPDAMTEEEIHEFVNDYAQAASNAMEAGFDGVEIHCKSSILMSRIANFVLTFIRRQWLPHRPVLAGRQQPTHRCLGRQHREACPLRP